MERPLDEILLSKIAEKLQAWFPDQMVDTVKTNNNNLFGAVIFAGMVRFEVTGSCDWVMMDRYDRSPEAIIYVKTCDPELWEGIRLYCADYLKSGHLIRNMNF